jgi:branched-subunit amino acid transport protein
MPRWRRLWRFWPQKSLCQFGATQISQFNWTLPQIWAGLAAFVVFSWLRTMLPTLIIGMLVYSALRYWF